MFIFIMLLISISVALGYVAGYHDGKRNMPRPMTPDGRPISREEVDRLFHKTFR